MHTARKQNGHPGAGKSPALLSTTLSSAHRSKRLGLQMRRLRPAGLHQLRSHCVVRWSRHFGATPSQSPSVTWPAPPEITVSSRLPQQKGNPPGQDLLRAMPKITLKWAQRRGMETRTTGPRKTASPRPTPRLPARPTHLVRRTRAGGAAAEPEAEAEAEAECGAQQHGGDQQRGRRPHRVPAQLQPRVVPAGRRATGHRGCSGGRPAASHPLPRAAPSRRSELHPRQVLSEPGPRRARGAARSAGFSGLCSLLPPAPLPASRHCPAGGRSLDPPPKTLNHPRLQPCLCTEHARPEACFSARRTF